MSDHLLVIIEEMEQENNNLKKQVKKLEEFKMNARFVLETINNKGRSSRQNAELAVKLLELDESGELYKKQARVEGKNK